jgi:hypothetical protein
MAESDGATKVGGLSDSRIRLPVTTLNEERLEQEVLPTLRSSTLFGSAGDADLHTIARSCRVDQVPAVVASGGARAYSATLRLVTGTLI